MTRKMQQLFSFSDKNFVCLFICVLTCVIGELEKVSELISGLAPGPEEESPYEALFEATSCHSLDSLTSGKSSDRDSGRPDSEAGKVSSSLSETHTRSQTCTWQDGATGFYSRWHAELPLEGDSGLLTTWLNTKPSSFLSLVAQSGFCNEIMITTKYYILYSLSFTERSPGPLITSWYWSWRRGELRVEERRSWGEEKCVGR